MQCSDYSVSEWNCRPPIALIGHDGWERGLGRVIGPSTQQKIKAEKNKKYSPPPGKFDQIYIQGMQMLEVDGVLEDDESFDGVACVKEAEFSS